MAKAYILVCSIRVVIIDHNVPSTQMHVDCRVKLNLALLRNILACRAQEGVAKNSCLDSVI